MTDYQFQTPGKRRLILTILFVSALGWTAWSVVQPWTRPFSSILAFSTFVSWLLLSILPSRPNELPSAASIQSWPKPALPQPSERTAGFAFGAFAVLTLLFWFLGPWEPQTAFDIIGFLWLMQNVVPLTIQACLIVGAAVSCRLWFAARSKRR